MDYLSPSSEKHLKSQHVISGLQTRARGPDSPCSLSLQSRDLTHTPSPLTVSCSLSSVTAPEKGPALGLPGSGHLAVRPSETGLANKAGRPPLRTAPGRTPEPVNGKTLLGVGVGGVVGQGPVLGRFFSGRAPADQLLGSCPRRSGPRTQPSVPWLCSGSGSWSPGTFPLHFRGNGWSGGDRQGPASDPAAFGHSSRGGVQPALAWAMTLWGAAGPLGNQSSRTAGVSSSVSPLL